MGVTWDSTNLKRKWVNSKMGQKKAKMKHERAETGIPQRHCIYGSNQPQ